MRELNDRHLLSTERVCQLVASGIWTKEEATFILLASPYPELTLGRDIDLDQRHLISLSLGIARTALLGSALEKSLAYVHPTYDQSIQLTEAYQYRKFTTHPAPDELGIEYIGPIDHPISLNGWSADASESFTLPPGSSLIALPRPRSLEEIRVFLRQDIHQARSMTTPPPHQKVALVYPEDFHRLSEEEKSEAKEACSEAQTEILVAPLSQAGLESEVWKRIKKGRSIRR